MKHVISDKYSIAWFKLAQCIAKGERERAMGIYRLLSHSIDNNAYAKQLEADIFLYFQDVTSALQKYKEAARLYGVAHEYIQALALYEHCALLDPHALDTQQQIFDLARSVADHDKIGISSLSLIQGLCKQGLLEQAESLFHQVLDMKPSVDWIAQSSSKLLQAHALALNEDEHVVKIVGAMIEALTSYQPYDLQRVIQQLENDVPRYRQLIKKYVAG